MSDPAKNGAVLYVKNVAQVSAFYSGVLSLDIAHSEKDHVVLELPTFQLIVHAIPEDIGMSIEIAIPPIRRSDTPIKLIFCVESIGTARSAAVQFGGELNPPEYEWEFQGYRVCDGYDPGGNIVQFRENRR
jgi:predicted enzyme related to lactoylglutathione lyase